MGEAVLIDLFQMPRPQENMKIKGHLSYLITQFQNVLLLFVLFVAITCFTNATPTKSPPGGADMRGGHVCGATICQGRRSMDKTLQSWR